jgi:hypothetical protein
MPPKASPDVERAEAIRLEEDARREKNWKRWGPYLAERQWGTVREDYSADGSCWTHFPHEHAHSRVYRWGEDGLLGFCDREARACFALALWNGRDPILKERLFGLTGPEGNHGEDVKECYYYLDSTPTHSYAKALYKYPFEYPYARLLEENARRGLNDPEFELEDTGAFDGDRYFDVTAEYAKAGPDDILVAIEVRNRSAEPAEVWVLPTLWFRNTWSWGRAGEGYWSKPRIALTGERAMRAEHDSLGVFRFEMAPPPAGVRVEPLFTDNETNAQRLWNAPNPVPHVKDAFHDFVIHGATAAVNPERMGTKAAFCCRVTLPPRGSVRLHLRLVAAAAAPRVLFGGVFDEVCARRRAEADAFYAALHAAGLTEQERAVQRQAYAGLLWSKQFYHYDVMTWLEGDPAQPAPPPQRREGRNHAWEHLYNRDVISMPDKWEYPWYAAWDLAFHMIPFARIDPAFAKEQLVLLLREWYMAPNGAIPAYEFAFSDVNPPVHAWACWRVYKMTGARGQRDRGFLARAFHKLIINFTWWVNRKDLHGKHIFAGGFLGLDNIGVFDRSKPLPNGGHLEQADGTAWMAFYCATMLSIALELAKENRSYQDVASKFFEHFVAITGAMNTLGGSGLWDDADGFYYDQLDLDGHIERLRVRSMVGLIPLFACEILERELIDALPGFKKRMQWFLENRPHLARHVTEHEADGNDHMLLAIPSRNRLSRVLRYVLDESEFLSPFGVRSLSRVHAERPYVLRMDGTEHRVEYVPGESNTGLFGGNSNWRGPVWFPLNFLLIEALQRYHHFYGDELRVECPVGSGRQMTLLEVSQELASRLARIFVPGPNGARPWAGANRRYAEDPHWQDLVLFHEYFHGDDGRGVGASHQTGWTALVARCLDDLGAMRRERLAGALPGA